MRIAGYEFSPGSRFQPGSSRDAASVGEHLDLLRKQHKGELTPEDVLEDAKHGNSPLHSFFEWDDTEAARAHRLAQARGLIRAVVAVYVDDGREKPPMRARMFVHINEPQTPHYRESVHAMSMARTRRMVLQKAWKELGDWRKRYADLEEFASLVPVIDDTVKAIRKKFGKR